MSTDIINRVMKNHSRLLVFFRNRDVPPDDAKDLVQEVSIRAWRAADRYQEQGEFKAWLFTIARNCLNTYLRQKAGQKTVSLHLISEKPKESREWEAEEHPRLQPCLQQLPPLHREIVRLYYVESMATADIASVTEHTSDQIDDKRSYAIKKLRECLDWGAGS
jgi:RNA polymerase sigma-70 factor (ECF subfamily)